MSKKSERAETAALKAYPEIKPNHLGYYSLECSNTLSARKGFQEGYEQAEKDLALILEDVNLIYSILIDMQDEGVERYGWLRQYYEETLKRFNEIRKK